MTQINAPHMTATLRQQKAEAAKLDAAIAANLKELGMAGEWRETTLGELVDFLSGGTPSKENSVYWDGSIPWVSAKDMKRLFLDDTEDHVTEEGISNGTKIVPANTVFLLTRGMTLLNDVPVCIARRPMTFNQDVKALRPKGGIREDFLPYLLTRPQAPAPRSC
jgi:type I restriction enzyme S subunit